MRSMIAAHWIGISRSVRNIGRAILSCWFLLGKFAQTLLFLLFLLFQISLALFKRVIWFCQDYIPDRR